MEDFEDVCRRVTAAFKAGRNCDPFIFGLAADAKPQYRELIERSYELGKQKTNENAEVMFVCVVLTAVAALAFGVDGLQLPKPDGTIVTVPLNVLAEMAETLMEMHKPMA